jgi:DNA-3-methyladenine glycosylase
MRDKRTVLGKEFYRRSAEEVAPLLLGKYLVRRIGKKEIAVPITEVEIYSGFDDKASHASKGKTHRAEIMFNEGGFWYVYLCYGMYWMLNIVVGEIDYPAAILIRGAGEYDGPGKLTRALKISKKLNNQEAIKENGLWIEDRNHDVLKSDIQRLPRVGINYAEEPWKGKLWRYVWHGHK